MHTDKAAILEKNWGKKKRERDGEVLNPFPVSLVSHCRIDGADAGNTQKTPALRLNAWTKIVCDRCVLGQENWYGMSDSVCPHPRHGGMQRTAHRHGMVLFHRPWVRRMKLFLKEAAYIIEAQ